MNALKQKILNREKTIGMHVNLTDTAIGRIAGLGGYDFIWIDLEHSYMSLSDLSSQILAVKSGGTSAIVRAPQDDLTFTKKILEMGPDGIIFPMIRSAEQANRLIASTLYPPYGTRGFGPMGAIDYGFKDAQEYVDEAHLEMCRFIQIEHIDAVENLDEIIKNPYIDGYIFGPNDLSGSINETLHVYEPNTTSLIEKVVKKLHDNGKYVGLSTGSDDEKVFEHWKNLGVDMLSAGADFGMLQAAVAKNRKTLEKVMKS